MAKQIPPNFEEHWEGANVMLRTQNSEGKELHANKETLGEKSSYFNAMFFSGFKEAYEESVEVPCSYNCMLTILRTIHSGEGRLLGSANPKNLAEVYCAADMFDIQSITSMYFEDFGADAAIIARTAVELGNRDMLVNCLEKMSIDQLKLFLTLNNTIPMFSKKDAVFVYEKIDKKKLEKKDVSLLNSDSSPTYTLRKTNTRESDFDHMLPEELLNCLSIADLMLGLPLDLSKKSSACDVAISTKNSDEKLLYTKKEILTKFSEKFNRKFLNKASDGSDVAVIHVDVNYKTMEAILHILQEHDHTALPPLLLYDLYRFAKKFNSQTVLRYTSGRLKYQATAGHLEVILRLDLQCLVSKVLGKMRPTEVRDWVLSGDEDLIYRNDGEEFVISSKATDLNLSLNDLRCIYEKLHSRFSIERIYIPNAYRPRRGSRLLPNRIYF